MKTIKQLMALTALLGLLAVNGAAADYDVTTMIAGGTNNVVALTTNTLTGTTYEINATKNDDVALYLSFRCDAASVSNVVFTVTPSLVSQTGATLGGYTFTMAANGTNVVSLVTNLPSGAVGYYQVTSIANQHGTANLTNVTVKYSVKPQRRG